MHKKLTLHSGQESLKKLDVAWRQFPLAPRFEIAPGQMVGAVVAQGEKFVFCGLRWGLIPEWWTEEERVTRRLFTARAESLAQRPAFAEALKSRRAVVPVDGFWCWKEIEGEEVPFYFSSRAGESLYLAAIWDHDEPEDRLAIISVESNRLVEPLASRMPAVMNAEVAGLWLKGGVENGLAGWNELPKLLTTAPSKTFKVSCPDPKATEWASLEDGAAARDHLTMVYGGSFTPAKPRFEPRKRLVRREHEVGGQLFFQTRSFTQEDGTHWHPVVDIENGQVFCDCPDFRYRHAMHEPDVWTPQWWCKHVSRAVANCKSHGDLPAKPLMRYETSL